MHDCKEVNTPIEKNLKLIKAQSENEKTNEPYRQLVGCLMYLMIGSRKAQSENEKTNEPYRQLVGCLMYLMIGSRPDICFALNYFSRFQDFAKNEHWIHLKRVLRYLKNTLRLGLYWIHLKRVLRYLKNTLRLGLNFTRSKSSQVIETYVDADWANDFDDRKSVTGFFISVFDNIVSWGTRNGELENRIQYP
ncbi:hypothetical protein QE152_g11181 [Popillia japonica]|uniref:Retrovirus-related Pol polyprotein from transposon TNT 1-94 n=1 Tax=Popillia japonica TaxID=7064 RepID=A0AAW1LSX9_POPJA